MNACRRGFATASYLTVTAYCVVEVASGAAATERGVREVVPRVLNHLHRSIIKGIDISVGESGDYVEDERAEVIVPGLEDGLLHSLNR
jgi:hypothetical protein